MLQSTQSTVGNKKIQLTLIDPRSGSRFAPPVGDDTSETPVMNDERKDCLYRLPNRNCPFSRHKS